LRSLPLPSKPLPGGKSQSVLRSLASSDNIAFPDLPSVRTSVQVACSTSKVERPSEAPLTLIDFQNNCIAVEQSSLDCADTLYANKDQVRPNRRTRKACLL
jgi:hypothetical protein